MKKAGWLIVKLFICLLLLLNANMIQTKEAKASAPYSIGTFYFADWNPEFAASNIRNTEKVYGRADDWWGGVKDHLTGPGPWGYGPFPEREPLAGWYDDREQDLMDRQILQASSRGLDHFAFYYYWKEQGGGDRPGQNVYRFQNSAYKDLMNFYIYLISDGNWPASDWGALIVPKLVSFMKDPSYKRTADGRPIVGFYGNFAAKLGGADQLKQGLQLLRDEAENAGLPSPLLLVNGYRNLAPEIEKGYDGFLPLNLAGIGMDDNAGTPEDYATSYPAAWNDFVYHTYPPETNYENYENYLFIPGGISGFDPRPWRGIGYGDHMGVETYNYADPSPDKFRLQTANVKEYLDSHPRSGNMATFYAWNEFGEGGNIEPTTLYGFGYLNALQETFALDNSKYKARVAKDGLTDLDPGLRLEFAPSQVLVVSDDKFQIIGKVTNQFDKAFTSGRITLDAGAWKVSEPVGADLSDLQPHASREVRFTVRPTTKATWSSHPLTIYAEYTLNKQFAKSSASTFVVQTPAVNGVLEPVFRPIFGAEAAPVKVNVRNYSASPTSGTYQLHVPEGWTVSGNGEGSFSLSGFTGGVHTNRRMTSTLQVTPPRDIESGSYELKLSIQSVEGINESAIVVKVGNYLANPGFETDRDGNGLADSWQSITGNESFTLSTDAAEGTSSQKITAVGYGGGIRQEWFAVNPNRSYIVEAWVKVEAGTLNIVEAEADAGFKTFLGNALQQSVSNRTWQKYTFTVQPKPNAANSSIRFQAANPGQTIAYVDQVVFKLAPME